MTPLRPTNFRLEEELLEALQAIKERVGIPVSEQVRRAIQAWIEGHGVSTKKSIARRTSTRRKG